MRESYKTSGGLDKHNDTEHHGHDHSKTITPTHNDEKKYMSARMIVAYLTANN